MTEDDSKLEFEGMDSTPETPPSVQELAETRNQTSNLLSRKELLERVFKTLDQRTWLNEQGENVGLTTVDGLEIREQIEGDYMDACDLIYEVGIDECPEKLNATLTKASLELPEDLRTDFGQYLAGLQARIHIVRRRFIQGQEGEGMYNLGHKRTDGFTRDVSDILQFMQQGGQFDQSYFDQHPWSVENQVDFSLIDSSALSARVEEMEAEFSGFQVSTMEPLARYEMTQRIRKAVVEEAQKLHESLKEIRVQAEDGMGLTEIAKKMMVLIRSHNAMMYNGISAQKITTFDPSSDLELGETDAESLLILTDTWNKILLAERNTRRVLDTIPALRQ
jgi:hypothetical protein